MPSSRAFLSLVFACAALVAAHCGGGGTPSAPTTPSVGATAPVITAVSALQPQPNLQSVTFTGTNFQAGLTLSVTRPEGSSTTVGGAGITQVTPTSFRASVAVVGPGTYAFEVINPNAERSNNFSAAAQGSATLSLAYEGVHLTEVSAGFPGRSIADPAVLQLRDGRWRILFTGAMQIRSAISPDGLAMTMEPGIRIEPGASGVLPSFALAAAVKVLPLADGRVRAYFFSVNGMYSAISNDEGLTFTVEPGVRLLASAIGDTEVTGGSVVRIPDGRWRMYFSGNAVAKVFSATSTDLLTWTLDPGVRVGAGATLSGNGTHPCAIVNANGAITIFYFRNTSAAYGIYASTSADGLSFTNESHTGIQDGNDPAVVSAGSTIRMYYNWGDNTNGKIYSARLTGSLPTLLSGVIR